MPLVHALVWLSLALGCLLSFVVGKRVKTWSGAFVIAVGLSISLFVVLNFGLAGCAEAHFCPYLGDTGLNYALSPIFAFPVFMLVAGAASSRKRAESAKQN